jgi:DNA-binding transcriptional ArsR family regulator
VLDIKRMARALHGGGQSIRMRILLRLADGETTVTGLQGDLALSQQKTSNHLGVLYGAGLVRRQRRGRYFGYTLTADGWDLVHGMPRYELPEPVC